LVNVTLALHKEPVTTCDANNITVISNVNNQ